MSSRSTSCLYRIASTTVHSSKSVLKASNRQRLQIGLLLQVMELQLAKIQLLTAQCSPYLRTMRSWRKRRRRWIRNKQRQYSNYSRRTINCKHNSRMPKLRRRISRKRRKKQQNQMTKPMRKSHHSKKRSHRKHKTCSLKKVSWRQKRKKLRECWVKSTNSMLRGKWFYFSVLVSIMSYPLM